MLNALGNFQFAACTSGSGVLPSLYQGITCNAYGAPQINSLADVLRIVGNVVLIVMTMAGSLAVIFIIVGGIWYVVSLGSPSRIERAKNTIMYAVIGLILVIIAEAIVTFLVKGF
jgi:hypothetical protein